MLNSSLSSFALTPWYESRRRLKIAPKPLFRAPLLSLQWHYLLIVAIKTQKSPQY
jgi:hypothetical protein